MPIVNLLRAEPPDAPRLATLIAESFLNLPPSEWLVPQPTDRRRIFPPFFRHVYLEVAMSHGAVYCTADRMAVAVWLPMAPVADEAGTRLELADHSHTPGNLLDSATERDQTVRMVTGDRYGYFQRFDSLLEAAHPTDRGAHDFLAVLAVHPLFQRQGYGTALLTNYHRYLDQHQRPAYLEAATEDLVGYYRRFGYTEIHDGGIRREIRLPNGPSMIPMWRDPLPATPSQAANSAAAHLLAAHVPAAHVPEATHASAADDARRVRPVDEAGVVAGVHLGPGIGIPAAGQRGAAGDAAAGADASGSLRRVWPLWLGLWSDRPRTRIWRGRPKSWPGDAIAAPFIATDPP